MVKFQPWDIGKVAVLKTNTYESLTGPGGTGDLPNGSFQLLPLSKGFAWDEGGIPKSSLKRDLAMEEIGKREGEGESSNVRWDF